MNYQAHSLVNYSLVIFHFWSEFFSIFVRGMLHQFDFHAKINHIPYDFALKFPSVILNIALCRVDDKFNVTSYSVFCVLLFDSLMLFHPTD